MVSSIMGMCLTLDQKVLGWLLAASGVFLTQPPEHLHSILTLALMDTDENSEVFQLL